MNEPVMTCPSCGTDIKLTETLAAPMIAAERKRIESELRARVDAIESREKTLASDRTKVTQLQSELERQKATVDELVAARVGEQRDQIAKDAAKKACDAAAAELKAARDALAVKDAKLAESQRAEVELRSQREALEAEKREFDLKLSRTLDAERGKLRSTIQAEETKKASDAAAVELKSAREALADRDTKLALAQKAEVELRAQREALEAEKREFDLKLSRTLDAEREKVRSAVRAEEAKKAADAADVELKAAREALAAKDQKLAIAQQSELEVRKQRESLEAEKREFDLRIARTVDEERSKIRTATQKEDEEQYRLKVAEKDKVIDDMRKQVEELRRKSDQASQQLQGEVQELDLEAMLRDRFPQDVIEPVAKGQRGADVLHHVRSSGGAVCGLILWESKRAKKWDDGWLTKARDNQREAKADAIAILTPALPKGVDNFEQVEAVWVTRSACALPLAAALRQTLIESASARRAMEGRHTKMDMMYSYLTGPQFKQRVSALAEVYINMRTDLDTEKRAIATHWKKREKQLERMLGGMVGMYGELQGIVGASLPEVEGLTMPMLEGPASLPERDLAFDTEANSLQV